MKWWIKKFAFWDGEKGLHFGTAKTNCLGIHSWSRRVLKFVVDGVRTKRNLSNIFGASARTYTSWLRSVIIKMNWEPSYWRNNVILHKLQILLGSKFLNSISTWKCELYGDDINYFYSSIVIDSDDICILPIFLFFRYQKNLCNSWTAKGTNSAFQETVGAFNSKAVLLVSTVLLKERK